jgi:hypothetical protein
MYHLNRSDNGYRWTELGSVWITDTPALWKLIQANAAHLQNLMLYFRGDITAAGIDVLATMPKLSWLHLCALPSPDDSKQAAETKQSDSNNRKLQQKTALQRLLRSHATQWTMFWIDIQPSPFDSLEAVDNWTPGRFPLLSQLTLTIAADTVGDSTLLNVLLACPLIRSNHASQIQLLIGCTQPVAASGLEVSNDNMKWRKWRRKAFFAALGSRWQSVRITGADLAPIEEDAEQTKERIFQRLHPTAKMQDHVADQDITRTFNPTVEEHQQIQTCRRPEILIRFLRFMINDRPESHVAFLPLHRLRLDAQTNKLALPPLSAKQLNRVARLMGREAKLQSSPVFMGMQIGPDGRSVAICIWTGLEATVD